MSVIPRINIHKCDGDGRCVAVCPNDVFELYTLTDSTIKKFPMLSRLKIKIKGAQKSRVVNSFACSACGLCVDACHEKAIELFSI